MPEPTTPSQAVPLPPQVETATFRPMKISEALALFEQRKSTSIHLENIRPVLTHAELVPFAEGHGPQVHTKMFVGLMVGQKMVVRTELHQIVPIKKSEEAVPELSVSLTYTTQIVYAYQKDAAEDFMVVSARLLSVMQSWPFWRSFAYASLAEMGAVHGLTPILNPEVAAEMAGFIKE